MTGISHIESGAFLDGPLTVDTVAGIFAQTLDYSAEQLTLDLSSVSEIDSAGLSLLVYWKQQAVRKNCGLKLQNLPEQVKSMIRISGLEQLFGTMKSGA
jgi:phospholipid transport system transporter-binding protein